MASSGTTIKFDQLVLYNAGYCRLKFNRQKHQFIENLTGSGGNH